MNQRHIASRQRVKQLRKFKVQKERQAPVKALLSRLRDEGKRELLREGKRQLRGHVRKRIRRILPFYY